METFLTLAIVPFIIGTAIMMVGRVLHETVGGWENVRGMAAFSEAFQIWLVGILAMALFGGW